MKTRFYLLVFSAALALRVSAATIAFTYSGTDGGNAQTTAQGSFSYANASLTTITLADLTSFTLHQTVNSANGLAIGFFDFTKPDLLAFSIARTGTRVTAAAFETGFRLQTSSPTGTTFKTENFIALTATTAKTQYRDQFFPQPPPPSNYTAGPIAFVAPEPSSAAFLIAGLATFVSARRRCDRVR